jgi:polyribonucleotide nucleotidyltransferase
MKQTFELDFEGRHLQVETGEIAKQADGAVLRPFRRHRGLIDRLLRR